MGADLMLWTTLTGSSFSLWGLMAAFAKLAVYLVSFLAAGLALVLVALPPNDERVKRSLFGVICVAAALSVTASAWRVMVQAGRLMNDMTFMTDPEIIAISLEGSLGTSTMTRMIGLAILLLAVFAPTVRTAAAILGAALVALSFGLTGHATRDPQWALLALITVHLMAVSFWFGALLPLYQLSKPGLEISEAARLSHRFGQQASIVVPTLIAVGGGFAYLLLGSLEAVLTSSYGQMLLVKLAIVTLLLGIAALNKLRLVPAMEAQVAGAAERFRTSLRWEALVFLIIFAATALLTSSFTVPNAQASQPMKPTHRDFLIEATALWLMPSLSKFGISSSGVGAFVMTAAPNELSLVAERLCFAQPLRRRYESVARENGSVPSSAGSSLAT